MSINIACSIPNCSNPVIGQCTGYKKNCGRYYCHIHSSDTLCANCANQKIADEQAEIEQEMAKEQAELIYQEYLAFADQVSKEVATVPFYQFTFRDFVAKEKTRITIGVILATFGVVLLGLLVFDSAMDGSLLYIREDELMLSLGFIGVPLFILFVIWDSYNSKLREEKKNNKITELLNAIEGEKKGFSEFWHTWVKQQKEKEAEKSKQALMGVLAVVGAIAVGAIASSLNESEYDRTRRAVRDELNQK